jgi:uncharacterized membrane protein
MSPSEMQYLPVAGPFFLLLLVLLLVLFLLVVFRVLRYAYGRIGIAPQYFFVILLLSLAGSYVNIPLLQFPEAQVLTGQIVTVFGVPYIVPMVHEWPGTIVAMNVGGAVIPIVLSIYLVRKNQLYGQSAVAVLVVALVCYLLAFPVPGIGIAVPVIYPPLASAITALLLSRTHAAPLAYIAGSLGTLIGADLLNLNQVAGLGAPVMSIGGAGTFDGIFVTGLMAVLLASIATRRAAPAATAEARSWHQL